MSDKGSDLDIFKDLANRGSSPAPGSGEQNAHQSTLLGLQAPAFPSPPSRAGTKRGMSVPPPMPSRAGGPPPAPSRSMTPPPPPPRSQHSAPPPPLPAGPMSGPRTSNVNPPPSAPLPKAPPGPSVDMDWDDEDEKTSIYDRGGTEDSARALLASAPPPPPPPAAGAPPRSMAPPPRVPAPAVTRLTNRPPAPPAPVQVPGTVPHPTPAPHVQMPYRERSRSPLYLGLAALVVAALGVGFFLWPRPGSLVVTVSGPGNKPLDAVEILLNGNKKCTSSPCTIDGLKTDTYYVRAHAAGYQAMADIAVVVNPGGKAVQNLTLVRALGTGVKVLGDGAGLKLYVDGREVGPLPQEIKDMEPGQHVVKVSGGDRLESFEKTVTVEPEQMQTIGPLKLHVLKGLATIQPGEGADGAKVILISGSDRRTLPKLPITLDIPTNQPHTLVATRRGFDQFKLPIKFEDGEVEHTFEVALVELSAGTPAKEPTSTPGPSPTPTPTPRPQPVSEPVATGSGNLNMNSIPVSNVLVDGRPVGTTPKMGYKVSAGSHTVTFLKDGERKAVPVSVGNGQTKTVAVRF